MAWEKKTNTLQGQDGAAKAAQEVHGLRVQFQFGSSSFNAGLLIKTDCSSPHHNPSPSLLCTNTRVPAWLGMSQISLLIQFKPSPSQGRRVDFPLYQLWCLLEHGASLCRHLNQQKISTTKAVVLLLSPTGQPWVDWPNATTKREHRLREEREEARHSCFTLRRAFLLEILEQGNHCYSFGSLFLTTIGGYTEEGTATSL